MTNALYEVKMRERYLAIVLLDLIGSTSYVQKHGARKAALHFQMHDRATRNLLYKYRGREIDRSDGFLCSFESVLDAVNFALNYQATIPKKTSIGARIGIHWGIVVEVHQDEMFVAHNAKRIELEGLSKNIAARTMSLCQAGQVLLTEEAFKIIRNRTNSDTPKGTMYACVGVYRFKGVSDPQVVYAVGSSVDSLQPPPSSEKVKRLGGPEKIKVRLRDRQIRDILTWIYWRLAISSVFIWVAIFYYLISYALIRQMLGLESLAWVDTINYYIPLIIDEAMRRCRIK
jgi:class 3 adenylate cyclase